MYKNISDRIGYPHWVRQNPRFVRLDCLDRLLNGTFYDHLPYGYYDEVGPNGRPIEIRDRRPSAQYKLPQFVAHGCARKLFAGRHVPRIRNAASPQKALEFEKSLTKWKLWPTMMQAAVWGSVGSVAVTFAVDEGGQVAFKTWRAKYCTPSFDPMGQLMHLRVAYVTTDGQLRAMGMSTPTPGKYWFVREWDVQSEVTYNPVPQDEWNPVEGFLHDDGEFSEFERFDHGFGFVPGQWFTNLAGGDDSPDGACTWEPAIPNSIELDYTLSQVGRGVRYNCAPQLVVKGDFATKDEDEGISRTPTSYIHLMASSKDDGGQMYGDGDAKLLEMNGAGTTAALSTIDKLRNLALEQIAASRKDPEKVRGMLSGRAMEFLDEDFSDLIMELQTQYGDFGLLPLVSKVAEAIGMYDLATGLVLQWPRLYQPTIQDIAVLIPALQVAITGNPPKDAPAKGSASEPGTPAVTRTDTPTVPPLLTHAEARAWLIANMDLGLMDVQGEDHINVVSPDINPTPDTATGVTPAPVSPEEIES